MSTVGGPTWSDIAVWYDELVQAVGGADETTVDCLLSLLPPPQGAIVLDVACRQGLGTRAVATAGAGMVGTDASETMADLARCHGAPRGVTWRTSSMTPSTSQGSMPPLSTVSPASSPSWTADHPKWHSERFCEVELGGREQVALSVGESGLRQTG